VIRDRAVAGRYAQALFGAALKEHLEEPVLEDLESLRSFYTRDDRLQNFLEAPDVLTEHKVSLLRDVFGGKVHELVIRFLLLMLEKKRIQHLPLAVDEYQALVEQRIGLVRAQVITAVPLDPEMAEKLRRRLEQMTAKKIRLEPRTDPHILGGVIVRMGETMIDGSVRRSLEGLRERLLSARVH
jgi:F-type H+-transporting ATPase subunit delta